MAAFESPDCVDSGGGGVVRTLSSSLSSPSVFPDSVPGEELELELESPELAAPVPETVSSFAEDGAVAAGLDVADARPEPCGSFADSESAAPLAPAVVPSGAEVEDPLAFDAEPEFAPFVP